MLPIPTAAPAAKSSDAILRMPIPPTRKSRSDHNTNPCAEDQRDLPRRLNHK
jgi:hypothetical protein